MGQFRVVLIVYPRTGEGPQSLGILVHSGAAYSVMPRVLLEAWGCWPRRMQRVVFADGRAEDWPLTEIEVGYEDRRATTTALMGPAGSATLLGAITLQGLGFVVDPVNHRLVPVDAVLV
jgi:predicted aspartyl protease